MKRVLIISLSLIALVVAMGAASPSRAEAPKETGNISARPTGNGARIVFTWNSRSRVTFTPETRNKKVYLHFDSPVNLQWQGAIGNLKPYLKQVDTEDNGKTVVLTLDSPAKARKFVLYGKDGVDFSKNGLELTAVPSREPTATMATLPSPPPVIELASKAEREKLKKKNAKEMAKAAAKAKKLATRKPARKEEAKEETVAAKPPAPLAIQPAEGETSSLAALSPAAGQEAAPASLEMAQAAPAAAPKVQEQAKPADIVETLNLPFLADDSFAVFVRNKTIWIAADESTNLTADLFRGVNKETKRQVQEVPAKQGKLLTIALDTDLYPSILRQQDGKLQMALSSSEVQPEEAMLPVLASQDGKNIITVETGKAGKVISATDPASGEPLQILPVSKVARGVAVARSFVEFSLQPTAQGIVIQQRVDALNVAESKETLEISAPQGLTVSAELKQQLEEAQSSAISEKIPPVFFPYMLWKLDDEKKFVSTQMKLVHASLSSNPEEANNARLKLLGLYLAEGLFAEANGMANDILRKSYKFYVAHKVAAMRGAANFFRYRFAEAEQDFSSPELAGLPETKMWLALCGELMNKDNGSFNFKDSYENTIRYYPPSFIQKIAVIAADKSIARKEYDSATAIFTTLQKEGLDEPVKKYIDFMRGKILSETGNEDEAAKIWERQAADVADRLIRARAEFSLVNMYLKEEKIPIEDAAKRLEKLRIVWRGDGLELNVLTLLGSLYVEQKDYARALRAWRDIVVYYSEVPDAIHTARKMEEIFIKLYNKNVADDMPPLSALSLFYEFRDLVPTGADGDLMIRNLAERLVKIDLLDRASQLLSHQVRNRLQGAERSRVGARLAEIYLMNRQPKQALETLKTTGFGDLPADIQLARIRLTAQALAQQGQLDKAIDVLSSDTSPDGNLLRLTVYWTNWDWPNVVAMAEEILSNRNDPSAPLTLQESEVLLKLATAYVYEHDSGQIQYLRDYFTPLLKGNPNKESFLFITSESGSIDYSNLSNLDKDIVTVKTFIDTSRQTSKSKAASIVPGISKAPPAAAPATSAANEPKKAVN